MLVSQSNRWQTAPHLILSATCSSQTQDFLLQSWSSLPPHTTNQDLDPMPRTSEDYVQVKPELGECSANVIVTGFLLYFQPLCVQAVDLPMNFPSFSLYSPP